MRSDRASAAGGYASRAMPADDYEIIMNGVMNEYRDRGYEAVVFGDIFLEDLRAWREEKLAKASMAAIFPLWKRDTAGLARDIINAGFRAIVTCVDTA
jgi:diphthamide synthase (EF-2-diphthine--ammonia ligase)